MDRRLGQTVAIEYRWVEGRFERSPAIIAEFVRLKVDLIVTHATPNVVAAKQVTSVIPIVFPSAGDPVGNRLVTSLAQPGGNVTGLSVRSSDLASKLVELLRDLLPNLGGINRGPAGLNAHVLPDAPTRLLQSLQERPEAGLPYRIVRGCGQEHADPPHPLRLLRSRRERPRRCAAEQRDELPALHSITSSASESSLSGTVSPSILAVSALMISSNLVDCMTGRSAGFAPLRMWPV